MGFAKRGMGFGLVVLGLLLFTSGLAFATELVVERSDAGTSLRLGDGAPFHVTEAAIADAQLIELSAGATRVVTWSETDAEGVSRDFYALGLRGEDVGAARATDYVLRLHHGAFEPLLEAAPSVEPALAAGELSNLYLVQFVTQPLEDYRAALRDLGARVRGFMPQHAHIVEMNASQREQVEALDFVRWVGPYHPAYRVESVLRDAPQVLESRFPKQRYSILIFESSLEAKERLAKRIESIGGISDQVNAGKFLTVATLTAEQFLQVVQWDEIAYVDRWSPLEPDMDLVRQQGGADELEGVAGYTGVGVRGESFDTGFNINHPDFASRPPLEHGGAVGNDSHGTACLGVCFGDGTGDIKARGLMPDGQPIAADYNNIGLTGTDRYTHSGELREAPYFAVFQTASVGSSRTTEYTTISADHDTLLFDWDVLHCQSQSNAGNQNSRPQAWAKNIVSGGAFNHYDTPDTSDDCWCNTGSIGPATDGRIKPDLSFYYDDTYTTYTTGDGYGQFGGTSGATPSICGHFGLFFQMWSDGIFGNEVDPLDTVFDNRPHMTTAKAFMINTAIPYDFSGQSADMTRVHQGWGVPNVKNLYDLREKISFIDESVILQNAESVEFNTFVDPGEPALKVTMTYADPAGNPASAIHRINDLTLKVTSPSGTVYWGNNGLLDGNWSVPGGSANTVDTVENVFVQNPEDGLWLVEVIASEVVEDSHVETPETDADFALVVSGGLISTCSSEGTVNLNRGSYACEDEAQVRVVDCDLNTDDSTVQTVTVTIDSTSEPGGETLVLTETDPASATFVETITLSTTNAPGTLLVAEGDLVTATYIDADDGLGGTNLTRTDTADVDCSAPVITNVQAANVQARSATITFNTDEPARGTVRYGFGCAALDQSQQGARFTTDHSITLTGLQDNATYFYAVDAVDAVGNSSTDDNGGACYSFTTPEIPDYFTELFSSGNDTDFTRFSFTPNATVDFYESCTETVSAFSTDPVGGTTITLSDDDSEIVNIGGGQSVSLYGTSYTSFYVGSNGNITFNSSDTDYTESISEHFSQPRISGLWDDLNPSSGGEVSWKQTADRVAVTWNAVPEYSSSNQNSFQIELFYDGRIAITVLDAAMSDGLIGLSGGGGTPPDFLQNDMSGFPTCGATGALAPGEAGSAQMLLVTDYDTATGALSISYGVPCEATDHVIEYGELTPASIAGYQWSGQECGLGATGFHTWDTNSAAHASLFFLVVANNGTLEGSYGQDSSGSERPEDTTSTACPFDQELANTCE